MSSQITVLTIFSICIYMQYFHNYTKINVNCKETRITYNDDENIDEISIIEDFWNFFFKFILCRIRAIKEKNHQSDEINLKIITLSIHLEKLISPIMDLMGTEVDDLFKQFKKFQNIDYYPSSNSIYRGGLKHYESLKQWAIEFAKIDKSKITESELQMNIENLYEIFMKIEENMLVHLEGKIKTLKGSFEKIETIISNMEPFLKKIKNLVIDSVQNINEEICSFGKKQLSIFQSNESSIEIVENCIKDIEKYFKLGDVLALAKPNYDIKFYDYNILVKIFEKKPDTDALFISQLQNELIKFKDMNIFFEDKNNVNNADIYYNTCFNETTEKWCKYLKDLEMLFSKSDQHILDRILSSNKITKRTPDEITQDKMNQKSIFKRGKTRRSVRLRDNHDLDREHPINKEYYNSNKKDGEKLSNSAKLGILIIAIFIIVMVICMIFKALQND